MEFNVSSQASPLLPHTEATLAEMERGRGERRAERVEGRMGRREYESPSGDRKMD